MAKGVTQRYTTRWGLLASQWNLVVYDLIKRFERSAPKITAYADDIGIIITGVCLLEQ